MNSPRTFPTIAKHHTPAYMVRARQIEAGVNHA